MTRSTEIAYLVTCGIGVGLLTLLATGALDGSDKLRFGLSMFIAGAFSGNALRALAKES